MWKRIIIVALILVAAYLLLWPVAIDPVAWDPAPAPVLTGRYEANDRLAAVERLMEGVGIGPEDVSIDSQGRIYGGMVDGRIMRAQADGTEPELFADTGGRPLGMDFDVEGNLMVADAHKGLLSVSPEGEITTLATEEGGVPFKFTDDVDVGPDGLIYFSDASSKFGIEQVNEDILEHGGHGRLLVYNPATKTTSRLLDGLQFANGVAVSPDNSFVLINETGAYRVQRFWLSGENAGNSEVFIDNLPGFPDGISSNGADQYWLAIYSPRIAMIDSLASIPFLRKLVMRLPQAFQPAPLMYGFVLGLNANGEVVHNLQDPAGAYAPITSVEQHGDTLYLGSLLAPAIGRLPAP